MRGHDGDRGFRVDGRQDVVLERQSDRADDLRDSLHGEVTAQRANVVGQKRPPLSLQVAKRSPDLSQPCKPAVYRSCLMPRVRVATVNCTLRSFALAIVGAEYVLRWLEPGTHRWEQFVTPLELTGFARAAGLRRQSLCGMVYDPFRRDWRLSSDTGVNYLFAATKAEV